MEQRKGLNMRDYLKMIQKALHNRAILFSYASASGILNFLDDATYLKMMYKVTMTFLRLLMKSYNG